MTIQFIDVPLPVCQWYAEKADELHIPTLELMAQVLTLWPETGKPIHVDDITPIIPAISTRRLWIGTRDDKPTQGEPRERTTDDQVASLGNLLGLALARIAILEQAQPGPGVFYTPEPLGAAIESGAFLASLDFPFGGTY